MRRARHQDDPWTLLSLDHEGFEDDVLLYRSLFRGRARRILVLAHGTARVVVPLARDGHQVTGLELAPALLGATREQVAGEGPEVRARIDLLASDMGDFELSTRFEVALSPLKSCLHLESDQDYRRALERLHDHIEPGGELLLDAFHPHAAVLAGFDGRWRKVYERLRPSSGERVVRSQRLEHDACARTFTSRHRWRILRPDGRERVRSLDLLQHYLDPAALTRLLESAGFAIEKRSGGYRSEPAGTEPALDPHYPPWAQSTALLRCRRR